MNDAPKLRVLIIDDSLVFRRFIGDLFEETKEITIIGEAQNGIEGLDMILKAKPDVILLDLEMPLMDGMTTLQHLMIHRPTPTIMFSSLSQEGTARCYDTLKNGAVDFICKDFLFHKQQLDNFKKILIDKVQRAAQMSIRAREPFFSHSATVARVSDEEIRVVFCEDCGQKEVVTYRRSQPVYKIRCSQCGDSIDLTYAVQSQYRRSNFLTIIGGGEGALFNILEIIPRLSPDLNGAILVVLHEKVEYVNSFTEYLDAISELKVLRGREGLNLEGGHCYILSAHDYMRVKPYSAQLMLERVPKAAIIGGPLDVLLASASTVYKTKASAIILSGHEPDADKGLAMLQQHGGTPVILSGEECYAKQMARNCMEKCNIERTYSTTEVLELIEKLHQQLKEEIHVTE